MTPVLFCQDVYINHWHFYSQILYAHTFNMDTHIDHFCCMILNCTEYDNIFINYSDKFCN